MVAKQLISESSSVKMEKKSHHADDLAYLQPPLSDFTSSVSAAKSAFYLLKINASASNHRKIYSKTSDPINSPLTSGLVLAPLKIVTVKPLPKKPTLNSADI